MFHNAYHNNSYPGLRCEDDKQTDRQEEYLDSDFDLHYFYNHISSNVRTVYPARFRNALSRDCLFYHVNIGLDKSSNLHDNESEFKDFFHEKDSLLQFILVWAVRSE